MRILAFSDLHRDKAAAAAIVAHSVAADVVIGAGDFANFGRGMADTIGMLRAITMPTVLVAGNHDRLDELRGLCVGWDQASVLHGDGIMIDGQAFFGLGFEVAARSKGRWSSYLTEADAKQALARLPSSAILVTHAPPHGIADQQADGTHAGSRSIRDAIERCQPKLNLCGHIHNAWGASGAIRQCSIHNLGPRINWFAV